MVLYVMSWSVDPGKAAEYPQWAKTAIQRTVSGPGVVEFRAYRPATGDSQVVVTFEFADMEAWAAWYGQEDNQAVLSEIYTMTTNAKAELWGPSPIVPQPIRPGA